MNKRQKFFCLIIALAFILNGCAGTRTPQYGHLSKGLPEKFFIDSNIDLDDSKKVSYKFESMLENPFPYYKDFLDLNPSFESVLKYYMNSKYSLADSSGAEYHVDVILEKCTYDAVAAGMETMQSTAVGPGGVASATAYAYNMKVTTEMTAKVRVSIDGKTSERQIMAMGEYTGNYTDHSTVTISFDIAIRGIMSRIDKFLNSTIGAATP
ncbi:MAG: hypothetical protein FWC26_07925 [Fibromonadales bacterium]|nr:hypothetical protein [Fibromonadales bacterium]